MGNSRSGLQLAASLSLLSLLFVCVTVRVVSGQPAASFKCSRTIKSTCKALVGYTPAAPTTLGAIQSLFQVKTLRSLLGVNNLPLSTPLNSPVPSNRTVRIPIPCHCTTLSKNASSGNGLGLGLSNRLPVYTVAKDDTLSKIASLYFSGLVTYQQIQAANGISNANLIKVGQKLWVPLPCSCDLVDGQPVVHLAHIVAPASSVDAIASEFGTNPETLMKLNGITDPKKLMAGQVLDVPLKACSSSISNSSADSGMLVANGTYVFTANNCVMCKCDATNNFTLQCEPSRIRPINWAACPATQCPDNLSLGNYTLSSTCSRSTCAYAGYLNRTILTTLVDDNTCSEMDSGSGGGSSIHGKRGGWSLVVALFCVQLISVMPFNI